MEKEIVRPKVAAKNIVEMLRSKARGSKTFENVCVVFAVRERARSQITVASLKQTMLKHGYPDFTSAHASDVIEFLSSLNIGIIHKDTKGRVKALINVKYTLQSIGAAALGETPRVEGFNQKRRFIQLPVKTEKVMEQRKEALIEKSKETYPARVTAELDGRTIDFPLTAIEFKQFLATILSKKH